MPATIIVYIIITTIFIAGFFIAYHKRVTLSLLTLMQTIAAFAVAHAIFPLIIHQLPPQTLLQPSVAYALYYFIAVLAIFILFRIACIPIAKALKMQQHNRRQWQAGIIGLLTSGIVIFTAAGWFYTISDSTANQQWKPKDKWWQSVSKTASSFLPVTTQPSVDILPQHQQSPLHEQQQLFLLLNEERAHHHLKPLVMDKQLMLAAQMHVADMAARQYFNHYNPEGLGPFERMDELQIPYMQAGENLARSVSAAMAHEHLMLSPSHRANILHEGYTRVGIAAIRNGSTYLFAQEFAQ